MELASYIVLNTVETQSWNMLIGEPMDEVKASRTTRLTASTYMQVREDMVRSM